MKTAQVKFIGGLSSDDKDTSAIPTGLIGPGQLEIEADGVRVVGKKGKKTIPMTVAIVVGIAGMIGAIVLGLSLGLDTGGRGSTKLMALIGLLGGIVPGAIVYQLLLSRLPGIPVDARIPWNAITVRNATDERVDLRSSHTTLTGDFAFEPADPQSATVLAEAFGAAQALPG
jgi:hypothetical protein